MNCKLGFTTLGGFAISAFTFWLRFSDAITIKGSFYPVSNLIFVLAFVAATIASIAFGCRLVFQLTPKLAMGLRWGLSIISATMLLGFEGYWFLFGCLGMNFMGQ